METETDVSAYWRIDGIFIIYCLWTAQIYDGVSISSVSGLAVCCIEFEHGVISWQIVEFFY